MMPNCFIVMPMTTRPELIDIYSGDEQHFDHVLELIFEPAVSKAGFEPIAPAAQGSDIIHANIIEQLASADLVLCDMSALNPNVFFELGIRTALDKPTCLVKDDATPHVPFDTALINYHTYKCALAGWETESEVEKLSAHISKSAERLDDGNSLWKYFGVHARAHMDTGPAQPDDKLDYIVQQLDALGKRDERRLSREKVGGSWTDLTGRLAQARNVVKAENIGLRELAMEMDRSLSQVRPMIMYDDGLWPAESVENLQRAIDAILERRRQENASDPD